jgi:hypothetical protein
MKKSHLSFVVLTACAAYVASYGILYSQRKSAGNMFYFQYLKGGPDLAERTLFDVFYPISWMHSRVFAGQKHVWDRAAPVDNPLAHAKEPIQPPQTIRTFGPHV